MKALLSLAEHFHRNMSRPPAFSREMRREGTVDTPHCMEEAAREVTLNIVINPLLTTVTCS